MCACMRFGVHGSAHGASQQAQPTTCLGRMRARCWLLRRLLAAAGCSAHRVALQTTRAVLAPWWPLPVHAPRRGIRGCFALRPSPTL